MTMTKLAIMSDLHIDVNEFGTFERDTLLSTLRKANVDHLHLAGDLSNDFQTTTKPFLADLSQEIPLSYTYNLGNHDMLGLDENIIQKQDGQIIELDGYSLIHPCWLV